jgi:hypothetical protein
MGRQRNANDGQGAELLNQTFYMQTQQPFFMKTTSLSYLFIAFLLLPSCATPSLGTYTLSLLNVRQEPLPSHEISAQTATKAENGKIVYHFQDENITIDWTIGNTRFYFILTNVSDHFIRIPWDEAVYVDQKGKVRRVIHDGIAFERKGEPQPFTVLPQNASIDDFLIPVDNIVAGNNNYVSWKEVYLFYDKQQNVGQEVRLVLPVMMQHNRFDYVFTFKVEQWQDGVQKRSRFSWIKFW